MEKLPPLKCASLCVENNRLSEFQYSRQTLIFFSFRIFLIAISAMKKQIFTFEILYFILNIYIDPLLSVMENKPYKQVEDALGET